MSRPYLKFVPTVAIVFLAACTTHRPATNYPADLLAQGRALAHSLLIVDTHIDVPYRLAEEPEDIAQRTAKGDFDYPRARAGGLNAPFMSIYIPAERELDGSAGQLADQLIDMVERIAAAAPDKFAIAGSTVDVERHFKAGIISLPLGMENGAPIAGDLANLDHFYDRGIRYITLTHSKSNHICDSSYDEARPWRGLSPFGAKLVRAMNDKGVMVDISHVSDEAFYDVLRLVNAPPIASHSSARRFTPGFERNMDDAMIEALAAAGGVIQINFGSTFVNQQSRQNADALSAARDRYLETHGLTGDETAKKAFTDRYRAKTPFYFADVTDVLDHIDHVRDLVGIDYVGIGSDYDGVGDSLPMGLKDVSAYPTLVAGLLARGYSNADVAKVLGGNIMRVWRAVEDYAATRSRLSENTG